MATTMTRQEMRTIVRHRFTEEENLKIGDAELNSKFNQAARVLTLKVGGTLTTSTLTAAAGGYLTKPTDLAKLRYLQYDGNKMGKSTLDSLYDIDTTESDFAAQGEFYYEYGNDQWGTFEAVATSASVVCYYEKFPTAHSLQNSPVTGLGDTDVFVVPMAWEQAMIEFVFANSLAVVGRDPKEIAHYSMVWRDAVRQVQAADDNDLANWGKVPKGPHF